MAATGAQPSALARRVVDSALTLAAEQGWANLRMHAIAERLHVPLVQIADLYPDLDAVADAWFARVRDRVLEEPPEGFFELAARDRLLLVTGRWFEAVEPHAVVTRDMLRLKLHPGHPHHWLPLPVELSRLMHWFLDAARIEGRGLRRTAQEIAITGIFTGALVRWALAPRPEAERARVHLARRLDRSARLFADRTRR